MLETQGQIIPSNSIFFQGLGGILTFLKTGGRFEVEAYLPRTVKISQKSIGFSPDAENLKKMFERSFFHLTNLNVQRNRKKKLNPLQL